VTACGPDPVIGNIVTRERLDVQRSSLKFTQTAIEQSSGLCNLLERVDLLSQSPIRFQLTWLWSTISKSLIPND